MLRVALIITVIFLDYLYPDIYMDDMDHLIHKDEYLDS